jgi:hypothetical protein
MDASQVGHSEAFSIDGTNCALASVKQYKYQVAKLWGSLKLCEITV